MPSHSFFPVASKDDKAVVLGASEKLRSYSYFLFHLFSPSIAFQCLLCAAFPPTTLCLPRAFNPAYTSSKHFSRALPHPSTRSQLLQTLEVAVEGIGVAAVLILIVELPDDVVGPAAGRGAGGVAVAGEDEGVGVGEGLRVARALRPPRRARVQQRVPPRGGVVRVAEVPDPRHRRLGRHHARALQVQHPRQRDPVPAPVPAVLQEVLRLRGLGSAGEPPDRIPGSEVK